MSGELVAPSDTAVVTAKGCAQPNCEGELLARGMCSRHYQTWRKQNPGLIHRPTPIPETGLCAPPECDGKPVARGLCGPHYLAWRKSHPGPLPQMTPEERFWAKVNKDGPVPEHCPELGPCWVWTRAKGRFEYGKLTLQKHTRTAHRLSYELAHGAIPDGLLVCHRCDNPPCVNPNHLFLGSSADNTRDMHAKGRGGRAGAKGERNPKAKLTTTQVGEIRIRFAAGEKRDDLAAEFQLNPTTLTKIISGRTWPDAPGPIRDRGQIGRRPTRKVPAA